MTSTYPLGALQPLALRTRGPGLRGAYRGLLSGATVPGRGRPRSGNRNHTARKPPRQVRTPDIFRVFPTEFLGARFAKSRWLFAKTKRPLRLLFGEPPPTLPPSPVGETPTATAREVTPGWFRPAPERVRSEGPIRSGRQGRDGPEVTASGGARGASAPIRRSVPWSSETGIRRFRPPSGAPRQGSPRTSPVPACRGQREEEPREG